MKQQINKLIKKLEKSIVSNTVVTEFGSSYIDPVDKKEISAHYAQSHAAAGMIISGMQTSDEALYHKGISLLDKLLLTYHEDCALPAYHFDFNHFALCLIYDAIKDREKDRAEKIMQTVLLAGDSNHFTTNWLPMRMYVAMHRYEWSKDSKYLEQYNSLLEKIKQVCYKDGLIDDRTPKGLSFNLQYDIATVAVLLFLKQKYGLDMDCGLPVGGLLKVIAPDGDINYLGRGCNQVFAWGPWIYILTALDDESVLSDAINYLGDRIHYVIDNHNMMLNDKAGVEKHLWWDYHYSSVYTAHLYLWLILAQYNDCPKIQPVYNAECDSGLQIHKNDIVFVAEFGGRKEYLSEKGPVIAALWHKKYGMIFKGSFGPWQGAFGRKYSNQTVIMHNFIGILHIKQPFDLTTNRLVKKLMPQLTPKCSFQAQPVFAPIYIDKDSEGIEITWELPKEMEGVFQLPVFSDCNLKTEDIMVFCDGTKIALQNIGQIYNQYGSCYLYQSKIIRGRKWCLKLN